MGAPNTREGKDMKDCCSNCNFQGDSKQAAEKTKIQCFHTDIWHKANHSCGYWKLYDSTLSRYERLKLTKSVKNKTKEYEKYLRSITDTSLVSLLGSIVIFFLILVVIIGAFILSTILQ